MSEKLEDFLTDEEILELPAEEFGRILAERHLNMLRQAVQEWVEESENTLKNSNRLQQ